MKDRYTIIMYILKKEFVNQCILFLPWAYDYYKCCKLCTTRKFPIEPDEITFIQMASVQKFACALEKYVLMGRFFNLTLNVN